MAAHALPAQAEPATAQGARQAHRALVPSTETLRPVSAPRSATSHVNGMHAAEATSTPFRGAWVEGVAL